MTSSAEAIFENIDRVSTRVFTFPTDAPESDGTLLWTSTTLVAAFVHVRDRVGMGYSYTHGSAAHVITETLGPRIEGLNAFDISACWQELRGAVRNYGDSGIAMMAVSAVDCALWDLKAKLLGVPLATLLGPSRHRVPVYGSGGFTSYSEKKLSDQLGGWARQGMGAVKMKIGRDPGADPKRIETARGAIGDGVDLLVDANGGYNLKQALAMAEILQKFGVTWYEEPVYHRDFRGVRRVRDHAPPGMEIALGEYGFERTYFKRLLDEGVVDVLQADATRCGITGFMQAAELCDAFTTPMSSHCAPAIHLHTMAAARTGRHQEYFHDHVRIEHLLFEGTRKPREGTLEPDWSRPGLGLELKEMDARKYENR